MARQRGKGDKIGRNEKGEVREQVEMQRGKGGKTGENEKSEVPPVVFTSDWQQLNGTVFVTQHYHMGAKKGNPAGAVPPREPPGGGTTNSTSRNHSQPPAKRGTTTQELQ